MKASIRNGLVAGAAIICALGVAGATTQAPKQATGAVGSRPYQSHSRAGGRLFSEYDLNRDGKITHDEFNRVVAQRFAQASHGAKTMNEQQFAASRAQSLQQHSDQMFRRADWNGDGKLTFDEFANPIRASFARADRQSAGFIACHPRPTSGAQGRTVSSEARRGRRTGGTRGTGGFCARDDMNHDGKVTRAELDQALQQQFAAGAKGAKFLSKEQLLAMQHSRSRDTSGRAFERLDRDHNGSLTLQEFAESENQLFQRLDRNGDGAITRDELSFSRRGRSVSRAGHG